MSDVWRGRIIRRDTPGRRHPRRPRASGGRLTCSPGSSRSSARSTSHRRRPGPHRGHDGARGRPARGDSIAVNGCCLTVVEQGAGWWEADVVRRDARRAPRSATASPATAVNLERPVRLQDRLGGHIVQGHVDGVGEIVDPAPDLRVRMPRDLLRYVVEKGSITVDGVSLTVVDVLDDGFTVAVIPHTAEVTTLGRQGPRRPGQPRGRRHGQVRRAAAHVAHRHDATGLERPDALRQDRGRRRRHRPGRDRRRRRRRGPRERGRPHHGGRVRHAREDRVLPPPHLGRDLRADHRRAGPTSSTCR